MSNVIVERRELALLRSAIEAGSHGRVMGPWGSGKTTLLRSAANAFPSGEVVAGEVASPEDLDRRFDNFSSGSVLLIDDAHLLSDGAARVVARELHRWKSDASDRGVVVLAHGQGAALPAPLERAWKDSAGVVVHLNLLDRAECSSFLSCLSPRRFDTHDVNRLWLDSGGIVRLLVELRDELYDERRSSFHIGALRSELSVAELETFDLLAVGGSVPIGVVEKLVDPDALSSLENRGLLLVDNHESVSLVGAIFGRVVEQYLTLPARRKIIRSLIDASSCEHSPSGLEQQISLAGWVCVIRGDLAVIRRGLAAALLLPDFERAIAFGQHLLKRDPADLESAHRLATAFEAVGKHDAASDVAREIGVTNEPLWEQRVRYNNYLANRDQPTQVKDQLSDSPGSPATADGQEFNAHLSWFHLFAGDIKLANDTAENVLNSEDATNQSIVWAATVHANASVLLGLGRESFAALDLAARRIAERPQDEVNPFAELQLGAARSIVHLRLGEFVEAAQIGEAGLENAIHPLLGSAWRGFIGLSEREQGDFVSAKAHFQESISILTGDPYGLGTVARSELSVCEVMLRETSGDTAEDITTVGFFRPMLQRNCAWVLAADGSAEKADAACAILKDEVIASNERDQAMYELLLLVDLARFGRARYAMERVSNFVRVENPLIRVGSQIVRALYERKSDLLLEATALARRISWGVVQDELALLSISSLVQAGRGHEAARLEVAWNPQRWPTPICRSDEGKHSLTPRERECAILVVQGRTSASIAEERAVSTRTVDNLLSHVYQKCGVTSRRELADVTRSPTRSF
jgi:DNA-binding CsgD family transcriptional regulator/tetratricopeptide (TPR) repeat protein